MLFLRKYNMEDFNGFRGKSWYSTTGGVLVKLCSTSCQVPLPAGKCQQAYSPRNCRRPWLSVSVNSHIFSSLCGWHRSALGLCIGQSRYRRTQDTDLQRSSTHSESRASYTCHLAVELIDNRGGVGGVFINIQKKNDEGAPATQRIQCHMQHRG